MALTTGSHQSPAAAPAPHHVDTAVLIAIRRSIQPRTGWWQFELRPWHYWSAITSAAVIAVGFAVLYVIAVHR